MIGPPTKDRDSASRPGVSGTNGRPQKPNGSSPDRMPPRRAWITFLVIVALNYLLMQFFFPGMKGR